MYNQVHFTKISEVLMSAALGVSSVSQSQYIVSDMVHTLSDFHENMVMGDMKEPYYIAIRISGVESGTYAHVVECCNHLGEPVIIAKIEHDKVCDFNMSVKFSHDMNFNF
jgi:hypothetical protein